VIIINEDIDIVKSILMGNTELFEIIVNRYEIGIQRYIYNMVRNSETSEDLTQEVFISSYNKLYTFNREYKFSTWLFQIAKNKTIDYIRKNNILDFIKCLNEIDRQILFLRYTKNKITFQQIALILNMPESSVKKRYYRIYDRYELFISEKQNLKTLRYRGE
jgi:DNA-directed RNA polymerase specialized sigma24 family protein